MKTFTTRPRKQLAPVLVAPVLAVAALMAGTLPAQVAGDVVLEDRVFRAGGVTYRAQTGSLYVPENRSDPDSRLINLVFARLKSTAEEPGPPLVFLAGGPGNAATPLVQSPAWALFLETADVVLLDQRGTGRSQPQLIWSTSEMRPERLFGDQATAIAHIVEIGAKARRYYEQQGIDITGYQTVESATDVDDLRQALGADKISLLGFSYGTHLGLEILRSYGEHIHRFVSVGTAGTGDMHKLPSDLDESLRQLDRLVAEDDGLDMPNLSETLGRLLNRLDREPMVVVVTDPRDGERVEVPVGRFGLQLILVADIGDTADLPVFPRLLHSMDRGNPSLLQWFVQKRYAQFSAFPTLMLVNRGASGASASRWERIASEANTSLFGTARTLFSPDIDRALGTPDLGDGFRSPVQSEVPTLFVSGTLDANTPPQQTERVRQGFSNSSHLVLANGGHEDLMPHPEVRRLIQAFLAGEDVDSARIEAPPLRFVPLEGQDPAVTHPALQAIRR